MEPDSSDSFLQETITLMELSSANLPLVIALVSVLLLASFFLSLSEYAFFSLNSDDMKLIGKRYSSTKVFQRIVLLKEKPLEVLSALLISSTCVNVTLILFGSYLIQHLISAEVIAQAFLWIQDYGFDAYLIGQFIEVFITVSIVVMFVFYFCEILPQAMFSTGKLKVWKPISIILTLITSIFGGVTAVLLKFSSSAQTWLNDRLHRYNITTTGKGEIDKAIDLTVEHTEDEKSEVDILKRIVKFNDVTVKQIMCSRIDIVAIDAAYTYEQVLELVRESGYSRFPVYNEDLDHILGILYVKDIIGYVNMDNEFKWQNLIREEVLFVPESKKIKDLLKKFQNKRMHMALVVDEFGGTEGLITLEDVMEEVIGDIRDEFDEDEDIEYRKIDNYNFIFDGKTLINDFCRITGVDTTVFEEVRGDSDSIAGLVLELLGEFPDKNTEVLYDGYVFTVLKVGKRRIEELKITIPTE